MNWSGGRPLRAAMFLVAVVLSASSARAAAHVEDARLLKVGYAAETRSDPEKSENCGIKYASIIQASSGEQFAISGIIAALYDRGQMPGVIVTVNAARLVDKKKLEYVELSHAEVKFSGGDTSKFKQIRGKSGPHERVLLLADFARAQDWLLIISRLNEGMRISASGPKTNVAFELPRFSKQERDVHVKFLDCQFAAANKFDEWVKAAKAKK